MAKPLNLSLRLSPNFMLAEFLESQTGARLGIDNTPSAEVLAHLKETANHLEVVRRMLGDLPLTISSGFRCAELNKAVGGAAASAHLSGWAVDFNCRRFGTPLQVAQSLQGRLGYDQLIHEFGAWVHISFDPRGRGEDLTISKAGTVKGIHPIKVAA